MPLNLYFVWHPDIVQQLRVDSLKSEKSLVGEVGLVVCLRAEVVNVAGGRVNEGDTTRDVEHGPAQCGSIFCGLK